jgi:hypothetical protein
LVAPDSTGDGLRSIVAPLLGESAWGASVGVGSFVTVEFGRPKVGDNVEGRTHGEWHLWALYCAWLLEAGGQLAAASEDPRPKMEAAIRTLDGHRLRSVDVAVPSLESVFRFDGGLVLRLFPLYSEDYEHWMLYTPDGHVLVVGPGSRWSHKSASEPRV